MYKYSVRRVVFSLFVVLVLTGCPKRNGILQVVNDTTQPLTSLHIVPSDSITWGDNLLAEPLNTDWLYEVELTKGFWDVLAIDALAVTRAQYSIVIERGKIIAVNVSEMTITDDGSDDGEQDVHVLETTGRKDVSGGEAFEASLSDGTKLTFPELGIDGTVTSMTLSKTDEAINLDDFELETLGYVRDLTFESFDPVSKGVPVCRCVPSLTIPASEISGVETDTLTAVRISDIYFEEMDLPAHVSFLPVNITDEGNAEITDFYFPDSIISDLGYAESVEKASTRYPRHIKYVIGTFDGSYNWSAEPLLMRFYPDSSVPKRRITNAELSGEQQGIEGAKKIQNVVILVHGHNEEEKEFGQNTTVELPWHFGYKRDVWTPLYEYVSAFKKDLLNCTAFYEYIYPTYHPIFTPRSNPRYTEKRLDIDFSQRVNDLVASLKPEYDGLRLYIVAHSMGGLVARAGIQLFSNDAHGAFQKLVTWGSPHLGTPLVSMRYVLGAPAGIYRAGPDGVATFPLENIDNTLFALRRAIDTMQVDTPGTRELRWANGHTETPRELKLDSLFSLDVDPSVNPELWNKYDLRAGTEIYNGNLRLLNANDQYRNNNKYYALYGITSKRARFELTWWYRPYMTGNDIAIGALTTPWIVEGADQPYEAHTLGENDGAVAIASMAGAGVMGSRYYVGDIDHEEYYGAPLPHGNFLKPILAQKMASDTFGSLNIEACENTLKIDFLEPAAAPIGTEITIHGKGFGDDLYEYFHERSRVTIGGVPAVVNVFEGNDTYLKVTVPEFNMLMGNVLVTVGEAKSNEVPFTSTLAMMLYISETSSSGVVTGTFRVEETSSYIPPLQYAWYVDGVLKSSEVRLGETLLYDASTGYLASIRVEVSDGIGRLYGNTYLTEISKNSK